MDSGGGIVGLFSFMSMFALIAWFGCGAIASHVASEKNRCGVCWFIWGVVLGPMALLATVGLPDKTKGYDAISAKTHVLCPECDEPVKNEARKCKHCGSRLIPVSEQPRR